MKRRRMLAAVAGLALVAAACGSSTTESDAPITDDFARVVVTTGAGEVQIASTSGTSSWEVIAEYSGDEPDFEPTVVGEDLIVNEGCEGREDCSVDYFLDVPEGTEVVVTTGSGDVSVTEISSQVTVETGSGVVFLNTVKGDIRVDTRSGDVVATKLESFSAHFTSESGRVDVAFEAIVTDLQVSSETGDVTAQLAGGPYNLEVESGSGSTDLKIDDDDSAQYNVVLRTSEGDLTVYKQ